jgi:hypothetical protein
LHACNVVPAVFPSNAAVEAQFARGRRIDEDCCSLVGLGDAGELGRYRRSVSRYSSLA